jgi:outer membrane lipoprotein-sorting protein
MQAVTTRATGSLRCFLVALVASFSIGCGQAEETATTGAAAVEQAAQEVGANVEQAIEIEKDTYKKKRVEGENTLNAAGDAYNAVLEEGEKKAAQ